MQHTLLNVLAGKITIMTASTIGFIDSVTVRDTTKSTWLEIVRIAGQNALIPFCQLAWFLSDYSTRFVAPGG